MVGLVAGISVSSMLASDRLTSFCVVFIHSVHSFDFVFVLVFLRTPSAACRLNFFAHPDRITQKTDNDHKHVRKRHSVQHRHSIADYGWPNSDECRRLPRHHALPKQNVSDSLFILPAYSVFSAHVI